MAAECLAIDWSLFGYEFVWFALIAAVAIALCSSCLGVNLVLKRYSMMGDGLSHVAFCAMCIAAAASLSNDIYVIMPVTVVAAVVLLCFGDRLGIKGDAAIAMISVGALALGYLIISLSSANSASDVCKWLFGTDAIYNIDLGRMILCVVMAVAVGAFYVLFYNRIFSVTFDETFLKASGAKVGAYNLVMAIVIGIVISLSVQLVGSLLITAFIIFPAISGMRLFKSFRAVVIFSAAFSVVASVLGMLISLFADTATGVTIVLVDAAAFIICLIAGAVKKRVKKGGTEGDAETEKIRA